MAIGEKIVAFLLGIKRSLIWRNLIELTPLSNITLEWREGINFLVIKMMALYCPSIWLDLTLVLGSLTLVAGLAGLGGIEVHGHLASHLID